MSLQQVVSRYFNGRKSIGWYYWQRMTMIYDFCSGYHTDATQKPSTKVLSWLTVTDIFLLPTTYGYCIISTYLPTYIRMVSTYLPMSSPVWRHDLSLHVFAKFFHDSPWHLPSSHHLRILYSIYLRKFVWYLPTYIKHPLRPIKLSKNEAWHSLPEPWDPRTITHSSKSTHFLWESDHYT